MRTIIFIILLLVFVLPPKIFASFAKSVVETKVEGGQVEVYQSVETTVNGETVKKESREPGKLELEIRKEGEAKPTVVFSQSNQKEILKTSPTPSSLAKTKMSLVFGPPKQIWKFLRKLWTDLTNRLK